MKHITKRLIGLFFSVSLLSGCMSAGSYNSGTYTASNNTYSAASITTNTETSPNLISSKDGLQTLFIEPETGALPIIQAIQNAKKTIDVQLYMLTMGDIIQELINATKRNVKVRLILEKESFNPQDPSTPLQINLTAYQKFEAAGVLNNGLTITWSNKKSFVYTHQKSMIVDGKTGYIMTMNLSWTAVSKNREYIIIESHPDIIAEMQRIFDADLVSKPYQAKSSTLVISPDNSRKQLEGLISSAKKNLFVGFEVVGDSNIITLLGKKAKAGVNVNVMLGHYQQVSGNLKNAQKMLEAGVKNIKFLGTPFIHGKVIVADDTAYIGSINLTNNSMEKNRELGIILKDKNIVDALKKSFDTDFTKNAEPMPAATPSPNP